MSNERNPMMAPSPARNSDSDAEDDLFCLSLYEEYLADAERGQGVGLEEAAAAFGITLSSIIRP